MTGRTSSTVGSASSWSRSAPTSCSSKPEQRRSLHDAGCDPGAEVTLDARRHGLRAAVGLKPLQVEAEGADALPEVRVVEVALVAEQRVVHLPKAPLQRGR